MTINDKLSIIGAGFYKWCLENYRAHPHTLSDPILWEAMADYEYECEQRGL